MVDLALPLLVGLASAAIVAIGWQLWARRAAAAGRARHHHSGTRATAATSSPAVVRPVPVDPVEAMRERPLDAVGARRALPRTARVAGLCPSCGRTLERGARRCPGCRAILVDGVPLRRAATFAIRGGAVGIVIGLFGGLVLASQMTPTRPGLSATASRPQESGTPAPVPAGVRDALDTTLAVHARLATAREALRSVLAAPTPDADGLEGQLRAIDIEAAEATALAAVLERWPGSRTLAAELLEFHGQVRALAAPGLKGDAAAARSSAAAVVRQLEGLEAVDGRTQAVVAEIRPAPAPTRSPLSSAPPAAPAS